uniref:Membrane spanning 4-domains A5 n=1 Tax=Rousettus aegyptiacus TaxID=9407 RepID=A0A7J8H2E1_ROUAE|nr:membrane spanning 4-domains A5 [Rousettus aegyptiacus]
MDSGTTHNPVFLVFPPQVTVPEFQSTNSAATMVESQIPFPKLLATKMKIFGTIQILVGLMNFSFGVIFLFTYESPYPRFPFIFVTGYPFWSSVLIKTTFVAMLETLGSVSLLPPYSLEF